MATVSVAEEFGFNFADEPCEEFLWRLWPCRKCLPCLRRRQQEWVARLTEELRQHERNYFVTLTYSEENVPADENGLMCFDSQRLQKLNADIRSAFQRGHFSNPIYDKVSGMPKFIDLPKGVKFRYYITGEYCPTSTHRPHYHAVYYGLDVDQYTAELIFRQYWPEGFISVFPATDGAAGYISKYLVKDVMTEKSYLDGFQMHPISLMSKRLGASYIDRMKSWHQADPKGRQYFQYHGEKKVLSRYYKQKLFSDEQRQEFADNFGAAALAMRGKYQALQLEHPLRYERLLQERKKYFQDARDAESWNVLKHSKLK